MSDDGGAIDHHVVIQKLLLDLLEDGEAVAGEPLTRCAAEARIGRLWAGRS